MSESAIHDFTVSGDAFDDVDDTQLCFSSVNIGKDDDDDGDDENVDDGRPFLLLMPLID